jgi:hypothetical protein
MKHYSWGRHPRRGAIPILSQVVGRDERLAKYKFYIEWTTSREADEEARTKATEWDNASYWVQGQNCVDAARSIAAAAGVKIDKGYWQNRYRPWWVVDLGLSQMIYTPNMSFLQTALQEAKPMKAWPPK